MLANKSLGYILFQRGCLLLKNGCLFDSAQSHLVSIHLSLWWGSPSSAHSCPLSQKLIIKPNPGCFQGRSGEEPGGQPSEGHSTIRKGACFKKVKSWFQSKDEAKVVDCDFFLK